MKTERLFFAYTRVCILFLLCVFAHGAFAQSDAGAKLNPWFSQLDLSFASGGTYANIKESHDNKKYTIEEARDIILENLSILRKRLYRCFEKSIF